MVRGCGKNRGKYIIGQTYWAANPKAGHNMQSCGILIGWTANGMAILENRRYGKIYVTVQNLNEHN